MENKFNKVIMSDTVKSLFSSDNIAEYTKNDIQTNFNEIRISCYKLSKKTNNFGHNDTVSIMRENANDEHVIWNRLSNKVLNREVLGFPLLYTIDIKHNNVIDLYFQRDARILNVNNAFIDIFLKDNVKKQILFQKILIIFTLYTMNIWSNQFFFTTHSINKTNIMFRVVDLFFAFEINYLVILSPKTVLKYLSMPEIDYIDQLLLIEDINSYIDTRCEYTFIELLVNIFPEYIDPKIAISAKLYENVTSCTNYVPGKCVYIERGGIKSIAYILHEMDNYIRVVVLYEKLKNFSIHIIDKTDIKSDYKFVYVTPTNYYVIGNRSIFC